MTMVQMEESIQEDLTQLGDPLSQLEYLMACARAHEGIPPGKTEGQKPGGGLPGQDLGGNPVGRGPVAAVGGQ